PIRRRGGAPLRQRQAALPADCARHARGEVDEEGRGRLEPPFLRLVKLRPTARAERRDVLAVEAQYLVEKAARVLGVDVPDVLEGASLPPKLSDDLLRRAPGRRASESAH